MALLPSKMHKLIKLVKAETGMSTAEARKFIVAFYILLSEEMKDEEKR